MRRRVRHPAMHVDAAGERNEYDSSEASYEGAFVATFQDYVRRQTEMGKRHVLRSKLVPTLPCKDARSYSVETQHAASPCRLSH